MSTRATYLFSATEWQPATTVYIHHDGYPEYAFNYFLNASNWKEEGLAFGFLEAFISANERAEITSGHEAHGDTDYRYTFYKGQLKVEKVKATYNGSKKWKPIYEGTVTDFIGKYRGAE